MSLSAYDFGPPGERDKPRYNLAGTIMPHPIEPIVARLRALAQDIEDKNILIKQVRVSSSLKLDTTAQTVLKITLIELQK